jgi:hypothetical protein
MFSVTDLADLKQPGKLLAAKNVKIPGESMSARLLDSDLLSAYSIHGASTDEAFLQSLFL